MKETRVRKHQKHINGRNPDIQAQIADREEQKASEPHVPGTHPDPRSSEQPSQDPSGSAPQVVSSPGVLSRQRGPAAGSADAPLVLSVSQHEPGIGDAHPSTGSGRAAATAASGSRLLSLSSTVWTIAVGIAVGAVAWLGPSLMEARSTPAAVLPGAMPGTAGVVRYVSSIEGDLQSPLSVAVGPLGEVYVTDSDNGLVKRFGRDGQLQATLGARAEGTAAPGQFLYPVGVAVDGSGNVYVSDTTTRHISVFDAAGNFARYLGEPEDGERAVQVPGFLFYQRGLLYADDLGANQVVVLGPDGSVGARLGAGKGSGLGEFASPGPIWVGEDGTVLVADSSNQRVQVFGPGGGAQNAITYQDMIFPRGVVVDREGRIHVASTLDHKVLVFTPAGSPLFSYGLSGSDWNGLGFPSGLALDGDRLYVADRGNSRVQVYVIGRRE